MTRHRLERVARIDAVLPDRDEPSGDKRRSALRRVRERLERADSTSLAQLGDRLILTPEEGGIELAPIVGSKAANLAEVERIAPHDIVPRWFVVTDRAFRLICDAPLGAGGRDKGEKVTAGTMIDSILARDGTSDAQKAFLIRKVWEGLRVPDSIVAEIGRAYRDLGGGVADGDGEGEDRDGSLVAVRSSGTEEDTLDATRAGEFETFLFIRGERDLMTHVKRVFASFWTERAIHNRALFAGGRDVVRGGVLVQRIVRSRVSGVVQTINVAEGRMREIVVNAGLGMGEGIVSGKVGADLIVIRKEGINGDAPPRFRYVTNDKREKVVYDARHGSGTVLIETLYHERFRPALEYTELSELVRTARRLEVAFGIPLDIEFGIEGSTIRILQARPIPLVAAILRETEERHPLQSRKETE
jgi:pyruvate,water dikinase